VDVKYISAFTNFHWEQRFSIYMYAKWVNQTNIPHTSWGLASSLATIKGLRLPPSPPKYAGANTGVIKPNRPAPWTISGIKLLTFCHKHNILTRNAATKPWWSRCCQCVVRIESINTKPLSSATGYIMPVIDKCGVDFTDGINTRICQVKISSS